MGELLIPQPMLPLLENLPSVFELELLLLVREYPEQDLSPDTLGQYLNADAERTWNGLVKLARCGFLQPHQGGQSIAFRFDPSPELAQKVEQLALLYAQHPRAIIGRIGAR